MSLKAFHLIFIIACIVLAVGFGIWSVVAFFKVGGVVNLIVALASFGAGVGLVFYERYFLKKTKNISYL
jgi:hypothetical protein